MHEAMFFISWPGRVPLKPRGVPAAGHADFCKDCGELLEATLR